METLYFAYGSNMNGARMLARVPTARHVGTATLYGWRLAERLYTDIERWRSARVRGVVYAMDARDLLALDRYEGFPNTYTGDDVRVKMDDGRWVQAWAYFMTTTARRKRAGMFQFTPARGGRPDSYGESYVALAFQFTPARGGRPTTSSGSV